MIKNPYKFDDSDCKLGPGNGTFFRTVTIFDHFRSEVQYYPHFCYNNFCYKFCLIILHNLLNLLNFLLVTVSFLGVLS